MEDFLLFVGTKIGSKPAKQSKKGGGKAKDRAKKDDNLKMGRQEAKPEVPTRNRRLRKVRTPPGSVSSGGTESLSSLSSGWEEIRDGCPRGITITGRDQLHPGGREREVPRRQTEIAPVDNPTFFDNSFSWEGGYSEGTESTVGEDVSALGWEPYPRRRQSEPVPVSRRPSPFGRAGSLRMSRQGNNDLTRNNNFGEDYTDGISDSHYADNSLVSNMAACEYIPAAAVSTNDSSYGRDVGPTVYHEGPPSGKCTGGTDGTDGGGSGREQLLNMPQTLGTDPDPFPALDRTIRARDRVAELKLLKIQMLKERRLANSQLRTRQNAHNAAVQAKTRFQGYLRTFPATEHLRNVGTPGHLGTFGTPEDEETSVNMTVTETDGLDPTDNPETGFQVDPRHRLDQYLHDLNMAAETKNSLGLPPRTSLRKPPAVPETSGKLSWREKRQQRLIGGYVQPAKQQLRRGYLRNLEDILQEGGEGALGRENGGQQITANGDTCLPGTQDFENQILLDTRSPPTYEDVLQGDSPYVRHVLDEPRNGELLTSQNGEAGHSHNKGAEGTLEEVPGGTEESFQARAEGTEAFIRDARDERRLYTAKTRPRAPDLQDRIRRYRDERHGKRTDSGHSTMKDPEESDNEFTQSTAISGLGKHSGTESEIDDSKTEAPDSQDEAMDSEGELDSVLEQRQKGRQAVTTVQRQHSTRVLPQAPRKILSAGNVAHVAPSRQTLPVSASSQVLSSTSVPANQKMFKVVLAGDAAVGKSSFILRLCKNEFRPNMNSTLGVDFQMKTMVIDDTPVTLQIWDTAGQERFRSIAKSYFRRADGVLLLYDCTYEPSFMHVREWVDAVEDGAPRTLPIMLCANKLDLRNEAVKSGQKVILKGHGEEMAREHGALFCETSAKEGDNVQDAVEKLMRQMMQMDLDETRSNILDLNKKEEKKSKCCGGS